MPRNAVGQFLALYANRQLEQAIAALLPTPQSTYPDNLEDIHLRLLLNYIDAALFGSMQDAWRCAHMLRQSLELASTLLPSWRKVRQNLCLELELMEAILKPSFIEFPKGIDEYIKSERDSQLLSLENAKEIIGAIADPFKEFFHIQIVLSQGWIDFKKKRPEYTALFYKEEQNFTRPWYSLKYHALEGKTAAPIKAIPAVFIQPYTNLTDLLKPFKDLASVFIFESKAHFIQAQQVDGARALFCDPRNSLYVLELYPHDQFILQAMRPLNEKKLDLIFFGDTSINSNAIAEFKDALTACLSQPREAFKKDTEKGDRLYRLARHLIFRWQAERLGLDRIAALTDKESTRAWYDSHKGHGNINLRYCQNDPMAIKLDLLKPIGKRPACLEKGRINLVHVVPQIIDGGHAPSRLLYNLIANRNADRFAVEIISTEKMQRYAYEYPLNPYFSTSSLERASTRLEHFNKMNVPVHILKEATTFEEKAYQVAKLLKKIQADVAVFHGPDVVNCFVSRLTDAPLRVLFDHGTPPKYPGFDLFLASALSAKEIYNSLCQTLHTKLKVLPFAIDVKDTWQKNLITKEDLGIPEDSLILTTISNHLSNRLSSDMCAAISEILTRVPKTYYMPMGPIEVEDSLRAKFLPPVHNRIIFLGNIENPSHLARSMDLYLNEFPFGSGLGILDAMASGCPVITMYDEKGPPQARYGGEYMGVEKAVKGGNVQEYIQLACTLLTNKEIYKKWSEHAFDRYRKFSDVKTYVKSFEEIIEDFLLNKHHKG